MSTDDAEKRSDAPVRDWPTPAIETHKQRLESKRADLESRIEYFERVLEERDRDE